MLQDHFKTWNVRKNNPSQLARQKQATSSKVICNPSCILHDQIPFVRAMHVMEAWSEQIEVLKSNPASMMADLRYMSRYVSHVAITLGLVNMHAPATVWQALHHLSDEANVILKRTHCPLVLRALSLLHRRGIVERKEKAVRLTLNHLAQVSARLHGPYHPMTISLAAVAKGVNPLTLLERVNKIMAPSKPDYGDYWALKVGTLSVQPRWVVELDWGVDWCAHSSSAFKPKDSGHRVEASTEAVTDEQPPVRGLSGSSTSSSAEDAAVAPTSPNAQQEPTWNDVFLRAWLDAEEGKNMIHIIQSSGNPQSGAVEPVADDHPLIKNLYDEPKKVAQAMMDELDGSPTAVPGAEKKSVSDDKCDALLTRGSQAAVDSLLYHAGCGVPAPHPPLYGPGAIRGGDILRNEKEWQKLSNTNVHFQGTYTEDLPTQSGLGWSSETFWVGVKSSLDCRTLGRYVHDSMGELLQGGRERGSQKCSV